MRATSWLWIAALAVGLAARTALAAKDGYEAPALLEGTFWPSLGIALVAMVGIAVAGFKKSRRTHLD